MSGDRRIIVEVVTPEVVSRLEAENALLRQELATLRNKHDALHMTVFRLMETVADLKRQKGKS